MKRRTFIAGLGAAAAWPLVARGQQGNLPVIGWLNAQNPTGAARSLTAFKQGLAERGYIEGQSVAFEYRWGEFQYDRLPVLAAELVRRSVALIVATGSDLAIRAAKDATATIPIVFTTATDPVKAGFVASLNHPGGNLTGATSLGVELTAKRVELVHELIPTASVIGLLVNPANANAKTQAREAEAAARFLGKELYILNVGNDSELDSAFTSQRPGIDALVITADSFLNTRAERLGAIASRLAIPAIFQFREFAAAGGLMSYGNNALDNYHQAGIYAGQILKGARPSELPVQQVSTIELTVNMKAAKVLGISMPLTLLGRADEVIE
jgi:putative ABC transport system substrate-binding protein